MVAPIFAWVGALLAGSLALVGQHLVKPRLPVYTLQVANLPTLTWLQGQLQTKLSTSIEMHNDNYMEIDVYGLVFDLFYMKGWEGELVHIGQVQDKNLAHQTVNETVNRTMSWRHPPAPLWQISPRANFSILDSLYAAASIEKIWETLSPLLYNWWKGSGSLVMPTSGVAYIKAGQTNTPFTVSLLCDNLVHTFSLRILGLECSLASLQPGWADVEKTVTKLRRHALTKLKANETGGVLQHASPDRSKQWSDALRRIAWEESVRPV